MLEDSRSGAGGLPEGAGQKRAPLHDVAACLCGEISRDTDWENCIAAANLHLVGPRLFQALRDSGAVQRAEPEAMEYLAHIFDLNAERNRRLASQLEEIVVAMNAAGLVPTALKGAAVLATADEIDETPRMLADLDLLVGRDETDLAERVLRTLGYEAFDDSADEHSIGSFYRPQDVGAVDLHFCLGARMAEVIPACDQDARMQVVPFGTGQLRVPDATLQFVMNLSHDMLHDEGLAKGSVNLRYLQELIDLASDAERPLDWGWIAERCAHWKFDLALELQSRMTCELYGVPVFPLRPRSNLGWVLHLRRMLKMHHGGLAKLEWQLVWRTKNALRWLRLDPTALIAQQRRWFGQQ